MLNEQENNAYPFKIENQAITVDQPVTDGWSKPNPISLNAPRETWEKEDLISYIYEFITESKDQSLTQEITSYLRETKTASLLQCENAKLKLINKQLQLKLEETERKYDELRGELERQKSDKNSRIEELNDLRVLNENFKTKLDSFSNVKFDAEHHSDDDGLKTTKEEPNMAQLKHQQHQHQPNKLESDSQQFRNEFVNERIEMNSENWLHVCEYLFDERIDLWTMLISPFYYSQSKFIIDSSFKLANENLIKSLESTLTVVLGRTDQLNCVF
jgi:hypothetical protein